MRPENRFDTSVDDLVDTITFDDFTQNPDNASGSTGEPGFGGSESGEAGEADARAAASTALDSQPADRSAMRAKQRARRLSMMAVVQAAALAAAWLFMALPWYTAHIPATAVMTQSGQLVTIGPAVVTASGFEAVANGSGTPFCPAAPMLWSMPTPLVFATLSVVFVVVSVLLRSVLAASASLLTALQAVRHLGLMHASVAGGGAGCTLGRLDTAFGRPLFIIALTAVVTLSALTLTQLWMLRSAEKRAKISAGEPVPPTLVEMIQGRLVGVAAAVVAESQRR